MNLKTSQRIYKKIEMKWSIEIFMYRLYRKDYTTYSTSLEDKVCSEWSGK